MERIFRGKSEKYGWLEGWYCPTTFGRFPPEEAIVPKKDAEEGYWHPEKVITETVGQYTGLTDKNGKKIFEGDIVSCKMWCGDEDDDGRQNWYISFVDGSFVFDKKYYVHKKLSEHNINLYDIEVIGNIHDNKDLLEVK